MGRFSAAKMIGAIDKKFQNLYNQLIDLLDTGYHVYTTIDGQKITIKVDPRVGLAFYQDDEFRGGIKVIDGKLFLTANAIKGPELDSRYMLWKDRPGVTGSPILQLYDEDLWVGTLNFVTSGVGLIALPTSAGDSSEVYLQSSPFVDNPEDFVNFTCYANKGAGNYAEINVFAKQLTAAEPYASYKFTPTGITATLNDVPKPVALVEEDTFTPTLYGATTAGTPTYTSQVGSYYVIGDMVFFDIYLVISAKTGMAGAVRIGDLPFLAINTANKYPCFQIGTLNNVTYPAGANQIILKGAPNERYIGLSWINSGGALTSVDTADIAANFSIRMSGNYRRA